MMSGTQIARTLVKDTQINPSKWERAWTPSGVVFFRKDRGLSDGEWIGWYPHILPFLSVCAWSDEGYYAGKWSALPTLPSFWRVRRAVRALLERDE